MDNSKYIALELIRRKLPVELIWVATADAKCDFPPEIKRVKRGFWSELYYLSTASVWVDTHLKRHIFRRGLRKRKDQLYIQTWHGSLGIKKIPSMEENTPGVYAQMLIALSAIDFLISNSTFDDNYYRLCFSTETIQPGIMHFGHPRNDCFFQNNSELVLKLKKQYEIPPDAHIFTYMPTFRHGRKLDAYQLDLEMLQEALETRFGGEWYILLRLHPTMKQKEMGLGKNMSYVIDVTQHPDAQEILVMSDVLCTDYSSCIFDFMLSGRPAFIYTIDLHDYETQRGLFYPIAETPFPIAQNSHELKKCILDFDEKTYREKVAAFLTEKGCMDDGKASQRVGDLIVDFLKNQA